MSASILVVGSINTDMVVKTRTLPGPGETVLGGAFFMNAGGKGANQAVAAARLGGHVTFVARRGADPFGRQVQEGFEKEGIDCRFITIDPDAPTGVALITVDERGENCIVVAPGANDKLTPDELLLAREALERADIILVQLEIPLETVQALAQFAHRNGKRLILNPAPARTLPGELLDKVFLLTPNEDEAGYLTDTGSVGDLVSRGARQGIITMGAEGALIWEGGTTTQVPAPEVKAVDTTAAGDVFNGALAVAIAEGMALYEAVVFANHAAALSVTKLGAQESAPYRGQVEAFMKHGQII
jgi:ribokinase